MSKQRPYGTFEEAIYLDILRTTPNELDELVECIIREMQNSDSKQMTLPDKYCQIWFYPILMLWQCLSRQYGEMCIYIDQSYILTENIPLLLENMVETYKFIWD